MKTTNKQRDKLTRKLTTSACNQFQKSMDDLDSKLKLGSTQYALVSAFFRRYADLNVGRLAFDKAMTLRDTSEAELVEALEYYADEDNWDYEDVELGKRAREVLEKHKKRNPSHGSN